MAYPLEDAIYISPQLPSFFILFIFLYLFVSQIPLLPPTNAKKEVLLLESPHPFIALMTRQTLKLEPSNPPPFLYQTLQLYNPKPSYPTRPKKKKKTSTVRLSPRPGQSLQSTHKCLNPSKRRRSRGGLALHVLVFSL